MSDPLAVKSSNPVLAWATAVGVIGLALGGFVLSFDALRDLAVRSGIQSGLAFIWPLIVDGFIVVATASAFALKRRGTRVTWYPWSALILFSAISVAGNAAHAAEVQSVQIPVWAATVVSSVPAIALLVASHLLVVMIDGGTGKGRSRREAAQRTAPSTRQGRVETSPTAEVSPASEAVAALPRLRAVESDEDSNGLLSRLEEVVAAGGAVTGALIADLEGVSERTGRRRVEQLRGTHPYLFGHVAGEGVG